ncbi:excalibur calcium-binding domain-containing protein [Bifidobacterium sp. SO1]|uniref:excalibur calcium-binding domain-containing protein n=1 Tax=Bifidobacterium sp. SO1 TaxID=2809029 RepID=UPI001BDD17A7|nr:excalibur calcium-binding domain-containing protein [Bifidobacterium sp. SO1]MBT1161741.1 excalibur calcium-binding domain-containing protein [Bifidobacterium sp. SO1]
MHTEHSKSRRIIAIALAATLGCPMMLTMPAIAMADDLAPQTIASATADKTDTAVKPIVISQKGLEATSGWYATDATHTVPKPDKNTVPGGLTGFTAGRYTLSYKVSDAKTQARQGNYSILKNATADKDGVISYDSTKTVQGTLDDGKTQDITFTAGDVLVVPKADGDALGDFTLTPVKDATTPTTPDKNDNQTTVKYDFDLSKVPPQAGAKLGGSLGIVAVNSDKDVPTAMNPTDRKNNPYTVQTQYVGVKPGTYKITYTADQSKKQLGAANGGWYTGSTVDKQGVFGPSNTAKYESFQVETDWWKPADGSKPITEKTITLPAGAFITMVGDTDLGVLHLEQVKDSVTDTNKPGDNNTKPEQTTQVTLTVTGAASKTVKDLNMPAGDWTASWKAADAKKPEGKVVIGSRMDAKGVIADTDVLYTATVAKDGKITFVGKDGKTVDHMTVKTTDVIRVEGAGTVTFDRYAAPTDNNNGGATTGNDNTGKDDVSKPDADKTVEFVDCDAAKAAGYTDMKRGEAGYSEKLDGDDDGIACESKTDAKTDTNTKDSTDTQDLASTGATVGVIAGLTTLLGVIGATAGIIRRHA